MIETKKGNGQRELFKEGVSYQKMFEIMTRLNKKQQKVTSEWMTVFFEKNKYLQLSQTQGYNSGEQPLINVEKMVSGVFRTQLIEI